MCRPSDSSPIQRFLKRRCHHPELSSVGERHEHDGMDVREDLQSKACVISSLVPAARNDRRPAEDSTIESHTRKDFAKPHHHPLHSPSSCSNRLPSRNRQRKPQPRPHTIRNSPPRPQGEIGPTASRAMRKSLRCWCIPAFVLLEAMGNVWLGRELTGNVRVICSSKMRNRGQYRACIGRYFFGCIRYRLWS